MVRSNRVVRLHLSSTVYCQKTSLRVLILLFSHSSPSLAVLHPQTLTAFLPPTCLQYKHEKLDQTDLYARNSAQPFTPETKLNLARTDLVRLASVAVSRNTVSTEADILSATYLHRVQKEKVRSDRSAWSFLSAALHPRKKKSYAHWILRLRTYKLDGLPPK